jgi:hypothetical protein
LNRQGETFEPCETVIQPAERPKPPASGKPESSPKRKTGCRIPENCPSPDDLAWCSQNFPHLNAAAIAAQFRDYWLAKATDATKVDWSATWRNWCRREAERNPPPTFKPTIKRVAI